MATADAAAGGATAGNKAGNPHVANNASSRSSGGKIPTPTDDYADYFGSSSSSTGGQHARLFRPRDMLPDHQRRAAYHAAVMGNAELFRDTVVMVMDAGGAGAGGSGVLGVWAAKAGARRVYVLVEGCAGTAKHAESVADANGVGDIVTVMRGAVEDIVVPPPEDEHLLRAEDGKHRTVDILISEWMGCFLLRESMLESLIKARDRFLKPRTGLMLPSHVTMHIAPIQDEYARKARGFGHDADMKNWSEFVDATRAMYGVDVAVLGAEFEREQKEYYLPSSQWSDLRPDQVLCNPTSIKTYDLATCTVDGARGLAVEEGAFDFDVYADNVSGPISGVAGWFTVDFKSRTDQVGLEGGAPTLPAPARLSTAPKNGWTHWGQQPFHFPWSIPLVRGETTRIYGTIEMARTEENLRVYNARIRYRTSRRKTGAEKDQVLMVGNWVESVYQMP